LVKLENLPVLDFTEPPTEQKSDLLDLGEPNDEVKVSSTAKDNISDN
jgi:hypothetical protein